jgi:hypothetical protein
MTRERTAAGVQVPNESITAGPSVQWNHIDGPLMFWAGLMHWLTWRERFSIWIGRRTVDEVACERWPHLARTRAAISRAESTALSGQT